MTKAKSLRALLGYVFIYLSHLSTAHAHESQAHKFWAPQKNVQLARFKTEVVNQTAVLSWERPEGLRSPVTYDVLILEYQPNFTVNTVIYLRRINENTVAFTGFIPGRYFARVTLRDGNKVIRGNSSALFKVESGFKDEFSPMVQVPSPLEDGVLRVLLEKRNVN